MKYILLIVLGAMALGLSACSLDEANSKQDVTNVQAGNMVYMTSSKRIFVMPSKTCTPPPPIVHSDR